MFANASELLLIINPGATSTKFAVFDGEKEICKESIDHAIVELQRFPTVYEQYPYRLELLRERLAAKGLPPEKLKAAVGRGGLLKPLIGGAYRVNGRMVEDLKLAARGEHASNLGAVMAFAIGEKLRIPALIVDPVSVDEWEDVARLSGLPELPRVSMSHALNLKAVARTAAAALGKRYDEARLIVVHLGTGISVSAHRGGRMVDVNNAREDGPFSPDRCGSLPVNLLAKLCYSGRYTYEEMKKKLGREGGVCAYLGTTDMREVKRMIDSGDERAALVMRSMAYQTAKEIGAMAAVLAGEVDRIAFTGGLAYYREFVAMIEERVRFIAPTASYPGEEEMRSLALGALRALRGEETMREYE